MIFIFIVQLTAKCNKYKRRYYQQSTDRGRGEIGEQCICPLSWSVNHNIACDDRYSERGMVCTLTHTRLG
jgi:hypothetical protein